MSASDSSSEMYQNILFKKEDINQKTLLLSQENLFQEVSLKISEGTPAEFKFIRTVSWFYALYYEAGKINVKFLLGKHKAYNLDPDLRLFKHYEIVSKLRTFFQHNLVHSEEHDFNIKVHCEQWFQSQCGLIEPVENQEWENCLVNFLKDACEFLDALLKCIHHIEQDEESRDTILSEWELRRKRYHPPHEFHKLIQIVAADLGQNYIAPVSFYNRYKDEWNKRLENITGDYNFEDQVRKWIEAALLENTELPINGKDIMEHFQIPPGVRVREILAKAKNLYNTDPYLYSSPEKLLEKLEQEIMPPNS